MADSGEVYYWLRLKRDFFKRHDMRILKAQPNGAEYLLFYLQLMVESIDHNGELRFSEMIPYDENMLSIITDTNIDIVRSAVKVLTGMGLIEIWDDHTIYVTSVQDLIGSQSKQAAKKMEYRRKRTNVLDVSKKCPTEIEIELEKETDKEIGENRTQKFKSPTLEEVQSYISDKGYHVDAERFWNYYESNGWRVGKNPMKSWRAAVSTWERSDKNKEVKEHDFGEYGGLGW